MRRREGVAAYQRLGCVIASFQNPLTRLEAKGLVSCGNGNEGVQFRPVARPGALAQNALRQMVAPFFAGSATSATTALLGFGERPSTENAAALKSTIGQVELV